MVDIPYVYQDLNILKDLTLDEYLASENLSIEVIVDEDTERA